MMKRLLSLSFVFLLSFTLSLSARRTKVDRIAELEAENGRLRCELDSLRETVARYARTLDSLLSVPAEEIPVDTIFSLSDSLLRLWYIGECEADSPVVNLETERFSSDVPDAVFIDRLEALNSAIPLTYNELVRKYCILYSERMRPMMGKMMGRASYYWPLFDEVFSHYGIPLELKALAIVESRLKPDATSRVGAKGLWQFMYGTAKGYDLKIDSWTDERMDPVKSTVAAARYLKDAYGVFGDWMLAIASYNCGWAGVNKAVRRSGGKRDFWEIYDWLPRETRNYIPAFIGALYASSYSRECGIVPEDCGIRMPVDTFIISRNLHFGQISNVIGIDESLVAELNPQYFNKIIPGNDRECVLRLPMECSDRFIDAADSLYEYRKEEYFNPVEMKKILDASTYGPPGSRRVVYKVKSGDVLGRIAIRHHVTVAQIKKWNGLRSNTIRIGQKLVIYIK